MQIFTCARFEKCDFHIPKKYLNREAKLLLNIRAHRISVKKLSNYNKFQKGPRYYEHYL